jgi:cytochrome b561
MRERLHYGTAAKALHWSIVPLLIIQYSVSRLMPDVHGGPPGLPMTWYISVVIVIFLLIVARFLWRLPHPMAPDQIRSARQVPGISRPIETLPGPLQLLL